MGGIAAGDTAGEAPEPKDMITRLDRFARRVSFIANILQQRIGLICSEMPSATHFELHRRTTSTATIVFWNAIWNRAP